MPKHSRDLLTLLLALALTLPSFAFHTRVLSSHHHAGVAARLLASGRPAPVAIDLIRCLPDRN